MTYISKAFSQSQPTPTRLQYIASTAGKETPSAVPQSKPLHDEQVRNNAGGFAFQISDLIMFRRFLFLGAEKGTFYTTETKLTLANIECIQRLVKVGKGPVMLDIMVEINKEARAAKSGPMLFALAYMAKMGDLELRRKVYSQLEQFLRIPTHLFVFLEYVKGISKEAKNSTGWGRLHRQFVSSWYQNKPVDQLTYQVTKYQQRNGWSHRDVFRLAHVVPDAAAERSEERQLLYKWIVKKELEEADMTADNSNSNSNKTREFLKGFSELQKLNEPGKHEDQVVTLIRENHFVREHIPTQFLNSKAVWSALLEDMPLGALIRNLNKLTKIGMFDGFQDEALTKVVNKITNEDILKKARIHPLKLIVAMLTYSKGRGEKGKMEWTPNQKITDALNDAYYKSFKYTEATGKRFLLGVDVSGSMEWGNCLGTPITPLEGAACLALTIMKAEQDVVIKGFSHTLVDVPISPGRRLDDNIKAMHAIPMGATDLSLPMKFALDNKIAVDCFVVLSDNETWSGDVHPTEMLRAYREKMGIPARYVNIQMTATQFSCADPNDMYSLEISGFDSGMLETITEFLTWELA